eukprot:SAG31_NODE_1674_length_7560_cov_2.804852_12_plen_59_part_00
MFCRVENVFDVIQAKVAKKVDALNTEQIEIIKRAKFQEFLDATNRKDGTMHLTVTKYA